MHLTAQQVRQDLVFHLSQLAAVEPQHVPSRDQALTMSTQELVYEAYRVLTADSVTTACREPARLATLKRNLHNQIKAVQSLVRVFKGDVCGEGLYDTDSSGENESVQIQNSKRRRTQGLQDTLQTKEAQSSLPKALRGQFLPPYRVILDTLAHEYAHRQEANHVRNHRLLKDIVSRLRSADRSMEALMLLEGIYDSDVVQGRHGVPFDTELFLQWLDLVKTIGVKKSGTKAFWAALDSAEHIEFSPRFTWTWIDAARMQLHRRSSLDQLRHDSALEDELYYLMKRLRPIMGVDDVFFPLWRTWEEQRLFREPTRIAATGAY
jgi:hypothetical protein